MGTGLSSGAREQLFVSEGFGMTETPMTVDEAMKIAKSHLQAGRLQDAERVYRAVLQSLPNHADANHNLGVLALQGGKVDVALSHFKVAVEANPTIVQFWVSCSATLLTLGRISDARNVIDQAEKRGLSSPAFAALRGKIAAATDPLAPASTLIREGRSSDAQAWLSDYLRQTPNDARALALLGELLRHIPNRREEALSLLAQAANLAPELLIGWLSYACALQQMGNDSAAAMAFQKVLKLDPNRFEALANLAHILMEEGRWEPAHALLQRACALRPEVADLHLKAAICLDSLGRFDEAETAARKAQALDKENRLAMSLFLAKLGREIVPARASDAFIKQMYNAGRADLWGLTGGDQRYLGAEMVADALSAFIDQKVDILDAGCGTGLVGDLVKRYASRLDGVDLSHDMLDKARDKGIYDTLHQTDIVGFFASHRANYDVITCAATLIHFGDLEEAFQAAAIALRPSGLFIFTVFPNDQSPNEFAVSAFAGGAASGLYEHGKHYIERTAAASGFSVIQMTRGTHEHQNGKPRDGLVVALRKE